MVEMISIYLKNLIKNKTSMVDSTSQRSLASKGSAEKLNMKKSSSMTGTKIENIQKALDKYENATGPGQYDSPSKPLMGTRFAESDKLNVPQFSMG